MLCVIEIPEEESVRVFVNPELVSQEGERRLYEGCLSVAGYQGVVSRSQKSEGPVSGPAGSQAPAYGEGQPACPGPGTRDRPPERTPLSGAPGGQGCHLEAVGGATASVRNGNTPMSPEDDADDAPDDGPIVREIVSSPVKKGLHWTFCRVFVCIAPPPEYRRTSWAATCVMRC